MTDTHARHALFGLADRCAIACEDGDLHGDEYRSDQDTDRRSEATSSASWQTAQLRHGGPQHCQAHACSDRRDGTGSHRLRGRSIKVADSNGMCEGDDRRRSPDDYPERFVFGHASKCAARTPRLTASAARCASSALIESTSRSKENPLAITDRRRSRVQRYVSRPGLMNCEISDGYMTAPWG